MAGICNGNGRRSGAASTVPCGLEHPATTLPTCCPRYPPGSTVLECRLEGDQPVAHVVQVAGDRNTATQNMCLLVETKQSPKGPLSRVISRPEDDTSGRCPCSQGEPENLMGYYLESCECPEGPVAVAGKAPFRKSSGSYRNVVTTLQTTKGQEHPDGPSSRIMYGPAIGETVGGSISDGRSRNSPLTCIDCTATRRGTSARITERSTHANPCMKSQFETRVSRDGGCPTVTGFQGPSESSCPCQKEVLETRVDECGARTCSVSFPQDCRPYCSYMESKSSCDGPSAKMRQRLAERVNEEQSPAWKVEKTFSPLNCSLTCPGRQRLESRDSIPRVERRNGLDPEDNVRPSPFRGNQARVCPPRCCAIEKPKSRSVCSTESVQQPRPVRPCHSRTSTLEDSKIRRPEKELDLVPCRAEAESTKLKVCESGRQLRKNSFRSFHGQVPVVRSEELVTRFRDHFPPTQLSQYETCRARRNGLQDQCALTVPRSVIELKRRELSYRRDNEQICDDGRLDLKEIDSCSDHRPTKPHSKQVCPKTCKQPLGTNLEKSDAKVQKPSTVRGKKIRLKKTKSRELYSGVVYIDCDCYHRNGLQHDCPRTACGGPPCKVKPWPECELATYFMNKWQNHNDLLDTLPPTSFCGSRKAWQEILEKEEQKSKEKYQDEKTSKKSVCFGNSEQTENECDCLDVSRVLGTCT